MNIVVDCRYIRIGHPDGIGRFTVGLVRALTRRHPVTLLVSDRRQLALLPAAPWRLAPAPTSILEPLVARQVNRLHPDIVFTPMQTMGSWGRHYRLVLTVHDLIYYRHRTPPRALPWHVRALWRLYHLSWWPQRLLLNRADGIVTVSETTKALLARHRLTRRPVAVVPNAADELPAVPAGDGAPDDRPAARETAVARESVTRDTAAGEGRPHEGRPRGDQEAAPHAAAAAEGRRPRRDLVYMGSFMPYKNVDTLVGALRLLPGYRLHLMSRVSTAERGRLTAAAGGAPLVFHDGASDEEYLTVLHGAAALVTASRDEGFGIPLLEAMRAGTPVVASDIPIFHEIGREAVLYAPPGDAAAFAARIRSLDDPGRRTELVRAGRDRAADFSWDRSAELLSAFLTEVCRVTGGTSRSRARGGRKPHRPKRHRRA